MSIVNHPLTNEDARAMASFHEALAAHPMTMTRTLYDELLERIPPAPGITYEPTATGTWARPATSERTGLFLHGGAFVFGSAWAYRHVVGHLATAAATSFFVVDYALAPEHPYPRALEDGRAALATLGEDIVVAGDSAGGNLALMLLQEDRRITRGVLLSPWTDLALEGATIATADDPLLTRAALAAGASAYLAGQDPRVASVLALGKVRAPVQAHVGTAEILRADAEALDPLGAEVHVWEGLPHVFQRNVEMLAGAHASLAIAGAFLRA